MTGQQWQFWIDRGGTFTDVVAQKPDGALISRKLLSENPAHYRDAAVQAIQEILDAEPGSHGAAQIGIVKMGTTVATNALLVRSGDPTVLVTTGGFADALRIGYQNRPDIFARQIVLPDLLHTVVIEATERVDAQGEVLCQLDEAALAESLARENARGIEAVAIVFMHAWRYPAHELQAAAIARRCGFKQISLSHDVGPLIKLVSRGDTTVVDAYLSPLIRRYIAQVNQALESFDKSTQPRLLFMQSNGGLTDASHFRGKDAILSGPAGGVVGMAQTAAMAGVSKVIGFDMGGTSTDVSLYRGGEYERGYETLVAGVRLRAPMMKIHTVAAGGGSILRFADGRLQVGPASAGANPGPACYRNGGPLTVTDANLILGRIRPEFFPAVFGPDGNEPLDVLGPLAQFEKLAVRVGKPGNAEYPPAGRDIAIGFLRIAVETMANAIKKISTQRGHDIKEYAINCFGGAGGQHACLVADAIGIERILIHPLAGVLSAYGMGLADIRAIRQQTIEKTLSPQAVHDLAKTIETLTRAVTTELLDQKIAATKHSIATNLMLRYADTDTSLPVPLSSCEKMKLAFNDEHKKLFGFVAAERKIIIDSLHVECIGRSDVQADTISQQTADQMPVPVARHAVAMADGMHDTPFYQRKTLVSGHTIDGPAIVVEDHATTVVETGWQAEVTPHNHLLLTRTCVAQRKPAVGTVADPVMLEVFNNLYMHIAEQMGVVLANTAQSVNIKERLDFSCAVFDCDGHLVANAPHMPVHLGSMGESVQAIIAGNAGNIEPGNVYLINAPYNGGTHLPDITVVTPVFDRPGKSILFYVASRGHHADVGGITPGSMPPASQNIEQEGVVFDNFLLVRDGRFRVEALREALIQTQWPARNPDQNIADLKAQVAANERGVVELDTVVAHYGLDTVIAYMKHVQDNAAASVRRVIDALDDGEFCYELDNRLKIRVAIRIDRKTSSVEVDFTGTSAQSDGNFNAPLPVCRAAVLYVFRTLVDEAIPMNEGCMRPIRLRVPPGSILDPTYPAAVVAGNVETSQCIVDALYGALGVMAASQGTMNNLTFGNAQYQYYETICGGSGAGNGFNGVSAIHSHMTNSRLTDPEILEWRYPVLVRDFSIRKDSGGAGNWRGGNGVRREIEFREPMTVAILSNHRRIAPFGMAGGKAAAVGINKVRRANGDTQTLGATDTVNVAAGDAVIIESPGGGGYGKKIS
ncbi:MAG: hydantoinase B/oxoprolinase family protein [Gammaproteobacteria bacterium]|nr:hydantoinase B/oxoprolinase family protein [Gammaproteobacteria bacterium]MDH3766856.1 hydantoinase B/oxoprolinase family protein [Gammaproteobacteria bacterium]